MAVQTPSYWKREEFQPLTEETTVYGNTVKIPEKWLHLWRNLKKNSGTPQERIAGCKLDTKPHPSLRWDLLRVCLEVYQEPQ